MPFINEGQCQSGQLEGISLRLVISKYEGNPLTNNTVIAQIRRNQAKFNNLTLKVGAIKRPSSGSV